MASPVPSGLNPPAHVRSFCPATIAPGRGGEAALVRALKSGDVYEVRGGAPIVVAAGSEEAATRVLSG